MRIGAGRIHGQLLAAAGGTALLGSLWLPWYAAGLSRSAWQTFTATPAVLLVSAALVTLLSVLELTQRAGDTSRLAILAGSVAVALVAYRLSVPVAYRLSVPPSAQPVHVVWGAYLSLVAAMAIIAGGLLNAAEDWFPGLPLPELDIAAPERDIATTRPTP